MLPLCFGIFESVSGVDWLKEHFGRAFGDIEAYFDWLGECTQFGQGDAIQAVRVAALALLKYSALLSPKRLF